MTLMILAIARTVAAQNTFTVADTNIPPQEQGEIIINYQFENEGEMCAYQFDLVLPEGVSLVPNGSRYKYQRGDCYNAMHSIVINYVEEEGVYRVVCASLNDTYPFNGTTGILLKLFVQADNSLTTTSLDAFLKNVKLSTLGGSKVNISDVAFKITVEKSKTNGDVNNDGQITIADVTALVNIIQGKDNTEPYQYNHNAADVDGKNGITKEDVTALVNMILNQ